MKPTTFVDTNIPIYAAGSQHPNREPSNRILRFITNNPDHFLTSTEVLQEIIHFYLYTDRWELGREVFNRFTTIMHGRIEPVYPEDAHTAADLAGIHQAIGSRDLFHVAVMRRTRTNAIISSDSKLDRMPGIKRLDPLQFPEWMEHVTGEKTVT